MKRILVLALLACLLPLPASAMIAVDRFRAPLRAAAEASAACPDIVDGRYVVHLRIDGAGRGSEADVRQAPEGITLTTEHCIEHAFEAQAYPSVGSGGREPGFITVSFPFIVAGHAR
ncbi:MAG: hypothetical protein K1X94_27125 [Sandaracinaceae bacterium]|nr:hypothetical protein [Sandaracinaceae bacterium]